MPRQGNNSYIFPGVGLAAVATRATRVTDEMFMAAARALAEQVSAADLAQGSLYPPLPKVREVSAHIAAAVGAVVYAQGFATVPQAGRSARVHARADVRPALSELCGSMTVSVRDGRALRRALFRARSPERTRIDRACARPARSFDLRQARAGEGH